MDDPSLSEDSYEDSQDFERSHDDKHTSINRNKEVKVANNTYDEAYELSQDLSVQGSFDGRGAKHAGHGSMNPKRDSKLVKNNTYDEEIEVSQSVDNFNMLESAAKNAANQQYGNDTKGNSSDSGKRITNKHYDEELELSRGSDNSVETTNSRLPERNPTNNVNLDTLAGTKSGSDAQKRPDMIEHTAAPNAKQYSNTKTHGNMNDDAADDDEDEDSDEHDDSYDNIEGAYNPKDYDSLHVTAEIRDLFQYIDRYKPTEMELETPLRCFIPDYLPAIGELDAFIKVPRPDKNEDGLGLRHLDEPSSNQSDPTVLELQLRAKSKKMQYGDVAVRSIENADKNPSKIDKWVQDIEDLHRTKPPPQVHYKHNMPDIDRLMEVWPEEFEAKLENSMLPSPDLDLSLGEYTKALCTILDIPVFENPIESLHLLFTLFIDCRNNHHFQQRLQGEGKQEEFKDGERQNNRGGADVLELAPRDDYD